MLFLHLFDCSALRLEPVFIKLFLLWACIWLIVCPLKSYSLTLLIDFNVIRRKLIHVLHCYQRQFYLLCVFSFFNTSVRTFVVHWQSRFLSLINFCPLICPAEWPEFVKNYSPWWASHTLDWLNYGKAVHVVHFENVKRDLFSHLKGMVQFLGLKVSEERLLCVEGQKDGNFKRSGLRKLEYDPYTPEMRASINELVRKVDAALRKRNMPGVPDEYMPRWYTWTPHLISPLPLIGLLIGRSAPHF